jgi:hypothetical protein
MITAAFVNGLKVTLLWIASGALAGLALAAFLGWRLSVQQRLVLVLLAEHGELTGAQLKELGAGALVYNALHDLEQKGVVAVRFDDYPVTLIQRGGRPRHYYKLTGLGL